MPSNETLSCNTCKHFRTEGTLEEGSLGKCLFNGSFNLYRLKACSCYKKNTTYFIKDTIQDEIYNTRWSNCWLSRKCIIQCKLEKLNPEIPKDNTPGFISFDVPNKARMRIRTQRFLTRKLNLNNIYLPDHLISNIANKINSVLFPGIKTKLIRGKDITEAYCKSVGGGSCMTGSCASCTKLYEMNPDKIQMLTMYYINDSARAILYKLDDDKGYYLDRVYASCRLLEDKMYAYADNNGWYRRGKLCNLTADEKDNLVISNLHYEDGHIPYMDTFGGSICNGMLTLSYSSYDIDLDSTNGYIGDGYVCEWCEEHVHEDNTVSIGDYICCEDCVNEHFTFCERCSEYVKNDDAVHIEDTGKYVCRYCAENNYTRCEDCGNYNDSDYAIVESDCICLECLENSGKYIQCMKCCEWFYEENTEDGHCEDCKPEEDDEGKSVEHIKETGFAA